MIEKTYRMLTQKQKDQIEYKAKETLRVNLSKITYKYKNLKETNNYLLEKKQEREIAKAYNKAELRKKNQFRKAEWKKVKEKVKPEARYSSVDITPLLNVHLYVLCEGIVNVWAGKSIVISSIFPLFI